MDVETAIRTRRTHKAFHPEPIEPAVVRELLELARWAPNHHLTEPWEFRVLGPSSLERLKAAAGPDQAAKLDRAPTLIACSCVLDDDPVTTEEDLHAAACAVYAVMLGAQGRGIASYWRTPGVLRTDAGRAAVGVPDTEAVVGLLHLGRARGRIKAAPARSDVDDYVTFLR
ncbi:MAG: nitroreductase family protein [Solirubrobacterales bacterium]